MWQSRFANHTSKMWLDAENIEKILTFNNKKGYN